MEVEDVAPKPHSRCEDLRSGSEDFDTATLVAARRAMHEELLGKAAGYQRQLRHETKASPSPPKPVPRSSPQRMIHSNQLAAKAYLHGAYVLDPPSTRHVRRRGSPWWAMPCRGRGAAGRVRRCRTIALWPAKLRAEPRPAFVPLPAWLSAPRELALVDGLPPRVQLRGSPARRRRTFVRCKCCSDAFAHISLPSQQGHHTSSTCCS